MKKVNLNIEVYKEAKDILKEYAYLKEMSMTQVMEQFILELKPEVDRLRRAKYK